MIDWVNELVPKTAKCRDAAGRRSGFALGAGLTAALLAVVVIGALWIRLAALSGRQLAWDEYFFVKSVRNILEFGLPKFGTGGYYERGLLPQYLTALSVKIFGDGYFAFRLPTALFGAATSAAGYLLGRRFLDRGASLLLAAILAVSSWQVEMSLFARMYAIFQFFAVCFFWALYRFSLQADDRRKYVAVGIAVLAVLTHELALFLVVFLFWPLITGAWGRLPFALRSQIRYLLVCLGVLALGYVMTFYDFRNIGVSGVLPSVRGGAGHLGPRFLAYGIGLLGRGGFFAAAGLAAAAASAWWLRLLARRGLLSDGEQRWLAALLALALAAAMFHQFAVVAAVSLVMVLRWPAQLVRAPYRSAVLLLGAVLGIWIALLAFDVLPDGQQGIAAAVRTVRRAARIHFFVLPDPYLPVIHQWAKAMPWWSAALGAGLLYQLIALRKAPPSVLAASPAVAVLVTLLLLGIKAPPQHATRYSHFLYPLVLCSALMTLERLAWAAARAFPRAAVCRWCPAAAGVLLAAVFVIGEDFDPYHLRHLAADPVAFRTGRYERFSEHWYPRWDYQGAAALVNSRARPQDKVILARDVDTVGYYLKVPYCIYYPRDAQDYGIVNRQGGTLELWSQMPMVSTLEDVRRVTAGAQTVWLVRYPHWDTMKMPPGDIWGERIRRAEVFTPGRDQRIEVWRIELKNP